MTLGHLKCCLLLCTNLPQLSIMVLDGLRVVAVNKFVDMVSRHSEIWSANLGCIYVAVKACLTCFP